MWEGEYEVNGQDLSQATHEEAVEAFRTAKEPIVVEVLRRVNKTKIKSRSPTMVSIGTQTDEDIYGLNRPPTPPAVYYPFHTSGLCQPASRRPVAFSPSADMGLTDIEMAHQFEYDDPYFDERPYDVEYEEVTLHRPSTHEKLGLTLCYGSLEDDMTDIFISEVEACSIAANDGRIREGDQILQINGMDVHCRDQAIKLFTEQSADISLLLARPQFQLDDGFMDEHNVVLDDLRMDILEKHHQDNMQIMASMLARGHIDEEGGTTDTATTENSHKHEKDSGVGRTDESTKNDESSEQENVDGECTNLPTQYQAKCGLAHRTLHRSNESFTSSDVLEHDMVNNISAEDCQQFREVLANRCNDSKRKNSESSIENELALLNKEMEDIQFECQEIVEAHMRENEKTQQLQKEIYRLDPHRSPRVVPRMGTRLEYMKHIAAHESLENSLKRDGSSPKLGQQAMKASEKDTSTTSAYNTGESCRSTPLTLELNQASDEGDKGFKNSMLCLATPTNNPSLSDTEKQTQTPARSRECSSEENIICNNNNKTPNGSVDLKDLKNLNDLKEHGKMGESLQDIYMKYSDVMYTNHANLQHTIAIQQRLFQQQMDQRSRIHSNTQKGQNSNDGGQNPNDSQAGISATPPDSGQMEWVVKRRPDGTRYVTRRPIRNKMLKERAKKISEERCGMTTDDDTMSELKMGRYWSKGDRKRHLEKAKDHKKKRELMKAKMDTLKETDEKKELNIVELSHRKMMRRKGKKVLDDFTTVQEMLAHGSKVAEGKTYNPLLSVTTV
ncbi:hypothetical protein ScPMuIL_007542 [Solemya velum]